MDMVGHNDVVLNGEMLVAVKVCYLGIDDFPHRGKDHVWQVVRVKRITGKGREIGAMRSLRYGDHIAVRGAIVVKGSAAAIVRLVRQPMLGGGHDKSILKFYVQI
jgi:hypothetical protein